MKGQSLGPSTVLVCLIDRFWTSRTIVSTAQHTDLGSKDRGTSGRSLLPLDTAGMETFQRLACVGHMFVRYRKDSSAFSLKILNTTHPAISFLLPKSFQASKPEPHSANNAFNDSDPGNPGEQKD